MAAKRSGALFAVKSIELFGFFEFINIHLILWPSARFLGSDEVGSGNEIDIEITQFNNFTIFPRVIKLDSWNRHHDIDSQSTKYRILYSLKIFNSSLKSGLVSIFSSNQKIIIQHSSDCFKNGNISLGLPETNIE